MYEIDKKKLAQELVAYRFPEGGGEYIKSQVARHQSIFEKDTPENLQNLLEYNEEVFTNGNFNAIIGKNDNGELTYMARYSDSSIISKDEIECLLKPNEPVGLFIVHHTDLDGNASAAIASRVFKDLPGSKEVVYFHYNYTASIKQNFINRLNSFRERSIKTIVIIVDLGLTINDLNEIFSITDRVIFIDHHRVSLMSFMECTIPDTTKITCLIDTRYSATYLAYILFSDLIKDYTGLEINETFPTMISVMDNAQTKILQNRNISIKVTKNNVNSLKDIEYTLSGTSKTMSVLKDPNKLLGKYIFIKNPLIQDKDDYPNLGACGMAINNYFIESKDLYPFIYNFYDKMLTDPSAVYEVVQIGTQLMDLDQKKLSLLGYNNSVYTSSFMGQSIHGLVAHNFNSFSIVDKGGRICQILLKYESNTLLSACVKSYNSILRNALLSETLNDFFPYTSKVQVQKKIGYRNMAFTLTSRKRIEYMFEVLVNRKLSTDLTSKYPEVYEIFDKIHFTAPKNGYKNNEVFKKYFIIISTIVFLVYQTKIQEEIKSLKR